MRASILIVSKNRKADLVKTLHCLNSLIDQSQVEVLVFLDGCTDASHELQNELTWVKWFVSNQSIGASAARHQIYPLANSEILIGLDDDAHPLTKDFLFKIEELFNEYTNVGILAFEEIKGVFESDDKALEQSEKIKKQFLCSEFVGCGFAIRKSVYMATNGFPVWVDIYGEESCVSIEVLAKGFDILYTNQIKVNHRVDKEQRKRNQQNYFRFEKQLKNATYYFLVYYPFPFKKIVKLYWHNFKKYALTDWVCFKIYFKTIFVVLFLLPNILRYRKPIDKSVIEKIKTHTAIKF
jgi:GT2 family glycosyltransferase